MKRCSFRELCHFFSFQIVIDGRIVAPDTKDPVVNVTDGFCIVQGRGFCRYIHDNFTRQIDEHCPACGVLFPDYCQCIAVAEIAYFLKLRCNDNFSVFVQISPFLVFVAEIGTAVFLKISHSAYYVHRTFHLVGVGEMGQYLFSFRIDVEYLRLLAGNHFAHHCNAIVKLGDIIPGDRQLTYRTVRINYGMLLVGVQFAGIFHDSRTVVKSGLFFAWSFPHGRKKIVAFNGIETVIA